MSSVPTIFRDASKAADRGVVSSPKNKRLLNGESPRICHLLSIWSRSGMELQLAGQLATASRNADREWIASSQIPESLTPELPEAVQVHSLDGTSISAPLHRRLARMLRATQTDIVHARGLWMLDDALKAARRAGNLPVVFSFHGFDDANSKLPWHRRLRWRSALLRCTRRFAVSEAMARQVELKFSLPTGTFESVHNGVDVTRFRPGRTTEARRTLGLQSDLPLILSVGSIMPVKGHDLLIESLRALRDTPFQLAIVGTDHTGGDIARRAAEFLPQRIVRLPGNVAEPQRWYAAADLYVSAARSEGISNAILEAMSSGLPVVATDAGGTPEVIDHGINGMLVASGDRIAMTETIARLLSQPSERARLGLTARLKAEQRFSLASAAAAWAAVYNETALKPSH